MKKKFIAAFTVKDIVFLAIISAVTLCTCAVMPLVVSLQTMIFGIAQVVTSLQIAILFSVGLMKVRKQGGIIDYVRADRSVSAFDVTAHVLFQSDYRCNCGSDCIHSV